MSRRRSILGGSAGNLVEWYDWYVYSAFSLYFAKSFFPERDLTAQLLRTSGIFALGFLMRPIGSWLMGRLADRHGRRTALAASVGLMCGGSLIIALTPGYASIGVAAPALLSIARVIQGISIGGEYGAAATYLTEMAPPNRRAFWSSFQYVTIVLGQLLALVVLVTLQYVFLDEARLEAWGWRIPFAIGAVLAVVVFWLRRGIEETPVWLQERAGERRLAGGVRVMLRHRRQVALALGIAIGQNVAFYTFTTYMQKYLFASAGFDKGRASLICAGALVVFMCAQPLAALLSDRIGRKPLLYWFGITGVLFTVPLMTAIGHAKNPWTAFALVVAGLLCLAGGTSTAAVTKSELFPAHIRAIGVGLPYAISASIFGGSAEYVALWFKAEGFERGYFWYASAMIGLSLVAFLLMPETRWRSAMDEGAE